MQSLNFANRVNNIITKSPGFLHSGTRGFPGRYRGPPEWSPAAEIMLPPKAGSHDREGPLEPRVEPRRVSVDPQ